MIKQHLGQFPLQLSENSMETYNYSPIPEITYEQLMDELFCHKYYLKNLCDEVRFPEWKIEDPLQVFRESLKMLKDISSRRQEKEDHQDQEDADGLLFCSCDLNSVHLLLKTQLLICKRYPDDLSHYKYPSYELLLSCLSTPLIEQSSTEKEILDSCLLKKNRYELVRTAIYLIFNTCLVSPLNAEALVRENGLSFLDYILNFYIKALHILTDEKLGFNEEQSKKCDMIMEIIVNIVHTISGISYFESGRIAILSLKDPQRFCLNWRKCLDLQFLHQTCLGCNMLKRYALEGVASMSKNEQLQKMLIGCHITWPILNSMLGYDPSFATSQLMTEVFESTISKAEQNFQSFLATRALGMLCGVLQIDDLSTSSNGTLCNAMKKVFTQPLARMLSNSESEELLQTLNLTVSSPLRLWDDSMRSELALFVKEMGIKYQDQGYQDAKDALADCNYFEYSNLSNEVNIGGVYIRIFNQMDIGDAIRDLPNRSHFAKSLVEFIGRSIKCSIESDQEDEHEIPMDKDNHWLHISDDRFIMAVRSLLHLVKVDGIVDDVMCEKDVIEVLFHLIELPRNNEVRLSFSQPIIGLKSTYSNNYSICC